MAAESLVMVGVDGSDHSLNALRWAATHAVQVGGRLQTVICWHWPATAGLAQVPTNFDPREDAGKALDEIVGKMAAEFPGLSIEQVVVQGHPPTAMVEQSKQAQLLVVGRRGHGAIASALMGSVSAHCSAHAACPVVVVP